MAGRSGEGRSPTIEIEARLPCSSASLLEERLYHSKVCLVVIQWTFLRAAARRELILEVRTWCIWAALSLVLGRGIKVVPEGGDEQL